MSPDDVKAAEIKLHDKEQNLMKMQEAYQKFKESKQEELLKKQEQLNKKIKKRIDSYLEKVAEDNSLDSILSYSDMTNPILFGTKKLDTTKQILKGLNEDYKSIKKNRWIISPVFFYSNRIAATINWRFRSTMLKLTIEPSILCRFVMGWFPCRVKFEPIQSWNCRIGFKLLSFPSPLPNQSHLHL